MSMKTAAVDQPDMWGTFLALRGHGFDAATIHRIARLKNDYTRAELRNEPSVRSQKQLLLRDLDALLAGTPARRAQVAPERLPRVPNLQRRLGWRWASERAPPGPVPNTVRPPRVDSTPVRFLVPSR